MQASGGASVTSNGNGLTININAKKTSLKISTLLLKWSSNLNLPSPEFDLAKNQSLSVLDRRIPSLLCASMTLVRLLETYQPGDMRYHFEPDLVKKQLNDATQAQIKQFYNQFFVTNHAQIAVTGILIRKKCSNIAKAFVVETKQPYQKINLMSLLKRRKVHALSEQREFGTKVFLPMPVVLTIQMH